VTLLFSITLNITFNEVALSPNSSAGYFVLLAMLSGDLNRLRRAPPSPARLLRKSNPAIPASRVTVRPSSFLGGS
jgi:hypothetical protein